jgi:FeS assembly SUF system protein
MIDRAHYEEKYPHIVKELHSVFDPEIPIDVFELGLIYDLQVNEDNSCDMVMTLTAPNCPVAGDMPQWIQQAVERSGHSPVKIELTFDPPWTPDMISEDGRLYLGM